MRLINKLEFQVNENTIQLYVLNIGLDIFIILTDSS
jgi:hypothetical protein